MKDVDVSEKFQTTPELANRKYNRMRLEDLDGERIFPKEEALKEAAKEAKKTYRELENRSVLHFSSIWSLLCDFIETDPARIIYYVFGNRFAHQMLHVDSGVILERSLLSDLGRRRSILLRLDLIS